MGDGGSEAITDGTGHRARLRARLLADHEALLDHELVEYLLALAIPRRDTKPLAKALLHQFGGIAGLLTADAEAIARVPGMGETSVAALKIAHAAALRLLKGEVAARPILSNWQALLDYLRADMAHHAIERVRVLHLNSRNMLIRDELMQEGSVDEAPVYVREVIRRAIDLGSTAIILVHNHPSGDPSPSRADIELWLWAPACAGARALSQTEMAAGADSGGRWTGVMRYARPEGQCYPAAAGARKVLSSGLLTPPDLSASAAARARPSHSLSAADSPVKAGSLCERSATIQRPNSSPVRLPSLSPS